MIITIIAFISGFIFSQLINPFQTINEKLNLIDRRNNE